VSSIVATGLVKQFGRVRAVDELSFAVEPGRVTGFLGPNGAGKTTTLRMVLGLVTPTAGTATVLGRRYADLPNPARVVGAVLEASSYHPGRTGRAHLRWLAGSAGLPRTRVEDALAAVGLTEAGDRRVKGYSLGMRQRLGLAAALLGDPPVLVLDEPANGLDPAGIAWLRGLLRHLAGEGRAVVISSHVLSEVEQTVDDVVIIARGRLVTAGPLAGLAAGRATEVAVVTPDPEALARVLTAAGARVRPDTAPGRLLVEGTDARSVGEQAFAAGLVLHELTPRAGDLEDVFLALTRDAGGGPS